MKTLLLVVCCLAGGSLAAPFEEDMIAKIIDPITSLAKVKDSSYECSRSCLIATFNQVVQLATDLDIKKIPDPKEHALLPLKLTCEAFPRGKDCLNTCPKGNLESILTFISNQLAYACEKFEDIKKLLNAIPESIDFTTCGDCADEFWNNFYFAVNSLINPQHATAAKTTCENKKCSLDCINRRLSKAGFEEAAKMNLELTKRAMRVVIGIHIIRNDGLKPPPECDWIVDPISIGDPEKF